MHRHQDEIPDPRKLRLSLKLNGKIMQDRSNEDLGFSLPRLIAWITQALPLYPGDVVSTGTPAGVGLFQKPQVWLKPGDVCELEIFGIGKVDQSGEVMHALRRIQGTD